MTPQQQLLLRIVILILAMATATATASTEDGASTSTCTPVQVIFAASRVDGVLILQDLTEQRQRVVAAADGWQLQK